MQQSVRTELMQSWQPNTGNIRFTAPSNRFTDHEHGFCWCFVAENESTSKKPWGCLRVRLRLQAAIARSAACPVGVLGSGRQAVPQLGPVAKNHWVGSLAWAARLSQSSGPKCLSNRLALSQKGMPQNAWSAFGFPLEPLEKAT